MRARPARAAERGSARVLPYGPPDEEGPEAIEMERGLLRLPHPLDDHREWMQLSSEQADHEVVVVLVEAVAGQAHVVAEPGAAECAPDARVLHEDHALLLARQSLERPRATQRVPDRPRQRRIADPSLRTVDQRLGEVGLVADRVGAA